MSDPNPTEFTRDPQPEFERRPGLRDDRGGEWIIPCLAELADYLDRTGDNNPFAADPPAAPKEETSHG